MIIAAEILEPPLLIGANHATGDGKDEKNGNDDFHCAALKLGYSYPQERPQILRSTASLDIRTSGVVCSAF
jgi:hypothetical protein